MTGRLARGCGEEAASMVRVVGLVGVDVKVGFEEGRALYSELGRGAHAGAWQIEWSKRDMWICIYA